MGILRIGYIDRKSKFAYPCKKQDVLEQLNTHIRHFCTEKIKVDNEWVMRIVPNETIIAEYQEGSQWIEGAPTEKVPVPPTPPMKSGR